MPLVQVWLRKGKSRAFLADAGKAIHEALVQTANVPADDRFQIVTELEPHHLVAHPSYGGMNRSDDLIIIQITLNVGRTLEIKQSLYAEIVRRLGRAVSVRADDVLISLVEVSRENWSFGKGVATYG